MLFCVFCSPKSSTVVLACFCRVVCDFPLSHFGHPPNMVTCVRLGPKLKAVAVWYIRGCARSGRVSWGEIWSWWYWLTSLLEANVNMYYKLSQLKQSHIHHAPLTFLHLPELTSRIHTSCRVLSSLSRPPVTSSWGCSSPYLRQQAAWEDLSTGCGAPSGLSSLVHFWDKWHSTHTYTW